METSTDKKSPPKVDLTKISNLTNVTDNSSIEKAIEKAKLLQKKPEVQVSDKPSSK